MTIQSTKFLYFFLASSFLFACNQSKEPVDENVTPEVLTEEKHHVLPELPDEVMFCGEKIQLDNFDVRERLDKEIIVNSYYHSSTIQSLKRANRYFPIIEQNLVSKGVPEDFKYLCLIESGLTQATSPAGAKGFWQFMPQTAKEYDLIINNEIDERLHIEKSTLAACDYLLDANQKFNNWLLTAASYNMGIGGVQNALKNQEVDSYFDLHLSNETSRYVFRILALKIIFENPEAYGFYPEEMELYEPVAIRQVTIVESQSNLKHWAKMNGSTYRMLKILNPWLKQDKLTCTKGDTLIIDLPK